MGVVGDFFDFGYAADGVEDDFPDFDAVVACDDGVGEFMENH